MLSMNDSTDFAPRIDFAELPAEVELTVGGSDMRAAPADLKNNIRLAIDFEKGRTGHGISDLSFYTHLSL
jgi:hypothetical protein